MWVFFTWITWESLLSPPSSPPFSDISRAWGRIAIHHLLLLHWLQCLIGQSNRPDFFCFLPRCQKPEEYKQWMPGVVRISSFMCKCGCLYKEETYLPFSMFTFKASNIIFGLLHFALPSSTPIMLAFMDFNDFQVIVFFPSAPGVQSSSLMTAPETINLCMATAVPQIWTPDNATQALIDAEAGTIFQLFSVRMLSRFFVLNG